MRIRDFRFSKSLKFVYFYNFLNSKKSLGYFGVLVTSTMAFFKNTHKQQHKGDAESLIAKTERMVHIRVENLIIARREID